MFKRSKRRKRLILTSRPTLAGRQLKKKEIKMKTAQLKTKWELFKFRTSIIFYSWLTLLFISIFLILKLSQWQYYPTDTLASVAKVHGCVFVDELKLTRGFSILKPCDGYKRFLAIPEVGKPHHYLIFAPLYSILITFSIFGLVLQNKKRNNHD